MSFKIGVDIFLDYEFSSLSDNKKYHAIKGAVFGEKTNATQYISVSYNRTTGKEWRKIRKQVFKRDGEVCTYCGTKIGPFEIDHKTPVAKGGSDNLENLVVSCRSCNRSKYTNHFPKYGRHADAKVTT